MLTTLAFIFGLLGTLLRAYVVHVGWGWFVLPATGLASPGIVVILGLMFLISLFGGMNPTYSYLVYKKQIDAQFSLVYSITSVLMPVFFLVVMFLIQLAV